MYAQSPVLYFVTISEETIKVFFSVPSIKGLGLALLSTWGFLGSAFRSFGSGFLSGFAGHAGSLSPPHGGFEIHVKSTKCASPPLLISIFEPSLEKSPQNL